MGTRVGMFRPSGRQWLWWWAVVLGALALAASAVGAQPKAPPQQPAAPASLKISANVDRTEVDVGGQMTLTITLEGQFQHAELMPPEFPKGFVVLAQSQASNVSVRAGLMTRSLSLVYLLLPQEAGSFKLGPFQVVQGGQPILTDPIDITVKKPVLPPSLQPHQRYTL